MILARRSFLIPKVRDLLDFTKITPKSNLAGLGDAKIFYNYSPVNSM